VFRLRGGGSLVGMCNDSSAPFIVGSESATVDGSSPGSAPA
jgi:hypothetical protein